MATAATDERHGLDEATRETIVRQLQRVQGQVGGIIRMIETGRECHEVVQQISAASRGLHQTGFRLLTHVLRTCIDDELAGRTPEHTEQELERMFLQLS